MNPNYRLLAILVMTCALEGCATGGAYLEPEKAHNLEQSITTAEQLEKALGVPSVTIPREDGKTMWVYQGIHKTADAGTYVPYLNFLIGGNDKKCTRLSVLVDRDTGKLSDWQYSSATGHEFWAKTNDKCQSGQAGDSSTNSPHPTPQNK